MIQDLRDLPAGSEIKADVCVVGAGPAGLAIAKEFIGSGLNVLLLESGGIQVEPEAQELNRSEVVGLRYKEHQQGRTRAFGGTGKSWAGQCLRMDPIDFERRPWVSYSGWPIDYATLDPYYERAETFFRVRGEVYDARNYQQLGIVPPAWSSGSIESRFTVYTPDLDTGKAQLASFREAANVTTLLHANAVGVLRDGDELPFTVSIKTLDGRTSSAKAKTVVLAAGALENARLLLVSNKQCSQGLGNCRDLVGRFLQDHPNGYTGRLLSGKGNEELSNFRLLYKKGGLRYFPKFCLSSDLQRKLQLLNGVAHLTFEYSEDSGIHAMRELYLALRKGTRPQQVLSRLTTMTRRFGDITNAIQNRLHGRSATIQPDVIKLQCHLEQTPDPDSRVRLSGTKDALGMPGLQIDWRKSELEFETVRALTLTVASEFRREGFGEIAPDAWVQQRSPEWKDHLYDCAHHIGTTRMSSSPNSGIVDGNCEVFGVSGLYIAGSSVFPTSGYANPTLTIVALAIRLADRLKAALTK